MFSIKIANVSLRKCFYVLAIKISLFHSKGCTSITPSLPQPNAPSTQNHTPVSAKFRHPSIVSFQTADTTVKTTSKKKLCTKHSLILLAEKTVHISVEGHKLFGSLQSIFSFSHAPVDEVIFCVLRTRRRQVKFYIS